MAQGSAGVGLNAKDLPFDAPEVMHKGFVVTQVDLQWSRGRIDYLGKKVQVQPGDTVQSLVSR